MFETYVERRDERSRNSSSKGTFNEHFDFLESNNFLFNDSDKKFPYRESNKPEQSDGSNCGVFTLFCIESYLAQKIPQPDKHVRNCYTNTQLMDLMRVNIMHDFVQYSYEKNKK